MSFSVVRKFSIRRYLFRRLGFSERDYGLSFRSRSLFCRESLFVRRNFYRERGSFFVRERYVSRIKLFKREKLSFFVSRFLLSRTKRLRRVYVEREVEKVLEREFISYEKGCVKFKYERNYRDKGVENEVVKDRRERRSERERERERDVVDIGFFRLR